jgi:Cu+-exporting ATPase
MRTLTFISLLSLALASSCATTPAMAEGPHHVDANAPQVKPGEAKLGDSTICPVSGEHFTVAADSPKVDYQGKTYYFCCNDCVADFQKNPEKFVAKLNAQ